LPLPRRKRITFEYVLLRGINDADNDARQLALLLHGIPSKVNVIPFNPHPGSEFSRPTEQEIARFQTVLRDAGLQINIRRPRGDDIQAACGQLHGESVKRVGRYQTSVAEVLP
jgi:23S rRNA (adenine2503-C2)-methyltransferase